MKSMRCSVIINTYNRAPYLRRLLAGLYHLRDASFEVVVVNGPSTDETVCLLEEYQGLIKVVDCPSRNLSHSRNLGIANSAGDIVAFIDDDALPCDADWLRKYSEAFKQNKQVGGMGGVIYDGDSDAKQFIGGGTSDYGFQIFQMDSQNAVAPDGTAWQQGIPGGNCAFRRSALIEVGGFDEYYRYYLDETDVSFRLRHAGYTIKYLQANGVRHYSASSDRRTNIYDRNWDVITKSDTYFALKNGRDPLLLRLYKTIKLAPQKNFVRDMIDAFYQKREISKAHWLKLRFKWFTGLLNGLWDGLTWKRLLHDFSASPPPFLPFGPPQADKPLRIALLTQTVPGQPNYGGIGRYTYDLARGLHERGHEVHILCRDEQSIHYESLGFVIHGLPFAQTVPQPLAGQCPILNKNLTYALAVERKLAELYAQGIEFDVVHASNWDAEAAALIREHIYPTALMLVTPLAQVIQTEKWPLNDDFSACVALDRWQIEQADAVCVPSKGVLKSYQTLMGLEPEKLGNLQITPLGIIPETVKPKESKSQGSRPNKLLFVGRLEWRKGAHTLLTALPDLMPSFPDWECHLVGDDSLPYAEGNTFKQLFQQKHQEAPWLDRVFFHGVVPEAELHSHYQTCDLFVAPSLFESFGLIFQEAMQYGKAVVGCRTGGVPEVVAHGVEGLLVTPDSPHELCAALAQLMQDDGLRASMGKAGQQRIQERDNYRTMAIHLEKVYQSLKEVKGEEYKARRERSWPRELPLLSSGNLIQWSGPWELLEAAPGQMYCKGIPGASLEFKARESSLLDLTALCHHQGGLLEVSINGAVYQYVDFYSPNEELDRRIQIQMPEEKRGSLAVKLRVHPERNPQSFGTDVCLRRVKAVLA